MAYLILDARYERVRLDNQVVEAAVLSAKPLDWVNRQFTTSRPNQLWVAEMTDVELATFSWVNWFHPPPPPSTPGANWRFIPR